MYTGSDLPEAEQEQQPESQTQPGNLEEAGDSAVPSTELIDGIDFNIPDSPRPFSYYYSPVPSPLLLPEAEASGFGSRAGSPKHIIRNSPGRPSKLAWKKCNASG